MAKTISVINFLVCAALSILVTASLFFEGKATLKLNQDNNYKPKGLRSLFLGNYFVTDKIFIISCFILSYCYLFYWEHFLFLFFMAGTLLVILLLKLRYWNMKLRAPLLKSGYALFSTNKMISLYVVILALGLFFNFRYCLLGGLLYLLFYRLIYFLLLPIDMLYAKIKQKILLNKIKQSNLNNTFLISGLYSDIIGRHLALFLEQNYSVKQVLSPLNEVEYLEQIYQGKRYQFSFVANLFPYLRKKITAVKNEIINTPKIKQIIYNSRVYNLNTNHGEYAYQIINYTLAKTESFLYHNSQMINHFTSDIYYHKNQEIIMLVLMLIDILKLKYNYLLNTNLMAVFNINHEEDIFFISNNKILTSLEFNDILTSLNTTKLKIIIMLEVLNPTKEINYQSLVKYCDYLILFSPKYNKKIIAKLPINSHLKDIYIAQTIDTFNNYYRQLQFAKPFIVLKVTF